MHLYPLCILYTDWQFGNTLNGTFVNKYAWDGICKYSTFQQVSFLLFLLFLSQNVWFFFFFFLRVICWLERMHVGKDKWVYEWRLKTSSNARCQKSPSVRKFAPRNLRGSGTSLLSNAFISLQISLCQKTWSFTSHLL